ncbi:MAG: type II toxin-antitoxin system PemK/MazF family toxin, partial [Candidatus Bipolaricaulia bacterium]
MVKRPPRRGDLFWVDFSDGRGAEQRGWRPALIIQNDIGNRYAPTTIIAAITSKGLDREYPTDVILPKECLPERSKVMCSQILTISKERLGDYIRSLPA